jgi:hypothetical protein
MWVEEVVAHLFSLIFHSLHPSETDYQVPEQFSFYDVRSLVSRPTPTWWTRVFLFVWLLPLDPSGMGAPTSSYATADIALRVSGALIPHHHDKVEETPSVGTFYLRLVPYVVAKKISLIWFSLFIERMPVMK